LRFGGVCVASGWEGRLRPTSSCARNSLDESSASLLRDEKEGWGDSSCRRDRGVSSGLAGVNGVVSRTPLVDGVRSEARRYWDPARASIAAGMRLVLGDAGVDCDCDDCRADGKDWRLLVRAMRDCLGQCVV
jgi:hypothetical protein